MTDGEVSTIFVAGMPFDAQPRELENMMRFMPGYEGIKLAGHKGGGKGGASMFVKFDYAENAVASMKVLHNHPFDLQYPAELMRVEIARSDMKKPAEAVPRSAPVQVYHQPVYQPPPPRHAPPAAVYYQPPPTVYAASGPPPAKRQRSGEDPGSIDTLAIFGATEKGYTERQLEDYFVQLPGFLLFKPNRKVGGGFVKFASPRFAHDALDAAVQSGLEAQMARTSMSGPGNDQGGSYEPHVPVYEAPRGKGGGGGGGGVEEMCGDFQRGTCTRGDRCRFSHGQPGGGGGYDRGAAPPPAAARGPPPRGGGGASGAQRHGGSNGPAVDTLILQGVMEKGWNADTLTDVFRDIPGFVTFKPNPRVGGGFVKFCDPQHAMDAIAAASAAGIEATMARSSMNA